jgi:uncharacterized membrane protein
MTTQTYIKTSLTLTLLGTLFSGYLSATKLFTKICAFNEPCPYFLGHPACFYGFGLFLIMLIVSILAFSNAIKAASAKITLLVVSALGVLFSGQWAIPELRDFVLSLNHTYYTLGLSTCIYGFVFFLIIFIVCLVPLNNN